MFPKEYIFLTSFLVFASSLVQSLWGNAFLHTWSTSLYKVCRAYLCAHTAQAPSWGPSSRWPCALFRDICERSFRAAVSHQHECQLKATLSLLRRKLVGQDTGRNESEGKTSWKTRAADLSHLTRGINTVCVCACVCVRARTRAFVVNP